MRTQEDKDRKDEVTKRRQEVAKLYWRGWKRQQIADELKKPLPLVVSDIKSFERYLSPKTERTLKYLQNSAVERLRPIQVLMWKIIDENSDTVRNDNVRISAGRLIKDVEEQVNKVRGIIGERLVDAPDKRLADLIKQATGIEAKSKGDGHKETTDVEDTETNSGDLPAFLREE